MVGYSSEVKLWTLDLLFGSFLHLNQRVSQKRVKKHCYELSLSHTQYTHSLSLSLTHTHSLSHTTHTYTLSLSLLWLFCRWRADVLQAWERFCSKGKHSDFQKYKICQRKKTEINYIQAALVIRGGYVPQKYREYQNREYQVQ